MRYGIKCTLLVLVLAVIASAQQAPQTPAIDGSQHPELIPDEVAWRMLLLSTEESGASTTRAIAIKNAQLQQAGIAGADLNAINPQLTRFHSYRVSVDRALQDQSISTDLRASLMQQREALFRDTQTAMEKSLSKEGLQALQEYIQTIKRNITIVLPGK
jgi:hypothetical protein